MQVEDGGNVARPRQMRNGSTNRSKVSATHDAQPLHIVRDPNAAGRAIEAMNLAIQGLPYDEVARRAGYGSRGAAFKAVQRELQRTLQHQGDELRAIEIARLDTLLAAMMPKAISGDDDSTWFVDRCLAIAERRAKLCGIDMAANQAAMAATTLIRTYDAETEAV